MNNKTTIDEARRAYHPVRPSHISTRGGLFWGAFDNMETEVSAMWIVRLMQRNGDRWRAFTDDEIEAEYSRSGRYTGYTFNRLTGGLGWVVRGRDGKYRVSHDFICRVFASAPNLRRAA